MPGRPTHLVRVGQRPRFPCLGLSSIIDFISRGIQVPCIRLRMPYLLSMRCSYLVWFLLFSFSIWYWFIGWVFLGVEFFNFFFLILFSDLHF